MNILDRDRLISAVGSWTRNCLIFDQLDSTHLFARRLMDQLDSEDIPLSLTLILAETQKGGLGRFQRKWSSDAGGLYLNIVWAMSDPSLISQLPMLAASAVHTAVTAAGVQDAGIKWPNDILVGGNKLGGILIHARHGTRLLTTVGIGINILKTPDLSGWMGGPPATSLTEILGTGDFTDQVVTLATTFLQFFTESLHNPGPSVDHWKNYLIHTKGENITVQTSSGAVISGAFVGVNPDGHLMIQTDTDVQTLTGGDIVEKL